MLDVKVDLTCTELDLFTQVVWRLRHAGGCEEEVRRQILLDVTRLLKSDYGASYVYDERKDVSTRCVSLNIDQVKLGEYQAHHHLADCITRKMRAQRQAARVDDVIDRRALEASEHYNEFLKPCGMHYGINVFFFQEGRDIGDLRIWRGADQPPFGVRDVLLLKTLTPYFEESLSPARQPPSLLTRREQAVVEHVAAGCSDKEIARLMGIGFTTVRTHLKNAMHKTGASNRTDLAVRGRPQ
ncbi:response regulator [Pseudomonas psychrotolerans L19]|uniref:helix-turn-helix transcriptional regulator n=1 Tax=Pseudomonas oryzihabitans TaxID=47885 RepID=UPI00023A1BAB|nr:LuxR C-terminal-related transcriptional regulator [Pseudomonas psychrotolerans]EHK72966.1 response regulator [Pseudomonas psychrotolerans L19]MBA1182069.1 response regulator transcription factor [Pseudomonas psychrotolerans]MBA1214333.1 response regulator transcription factor [Pseudomonas psychrotolerans]